MPPKVKTVAGILCFRAQGSHTPRFRLKPIKSYWPHPVAGGDSFETGRLLIANREGLACHPWPILPWILLLFMFAGSPLTGAIAGEIPSGSHGVQKPVDPAVIRELGFSRMLVVQRRPYVASHVYTYHSDGQYNGGGLYISDLTTGDLRRLVDASQGQILDCDLSWDGQGILFSMRTGPETGMNPLAGQSYCCASDGIGHRLENVVL